MIDFKDRAHILKAETRAALEHPEEFADQLRRTHPAKPTRAPRLQVRISGPTVDALETARQIDTARPARSIGMNKNHADPKDRAGTLTGETVRIYLNY